MRQIKNIYNALFRNKTYVVVHMKNHNGRKETHLVIPDKNGYTKIRDGDYFLNSDYAILNWKGRLHFLCTEGQAIPTHDFETKKEDIIFRSSEIKTAIENRVAEALFSKQKEIILYLVAAGWIVNLLALIYVATKLQPIQVMP